MAASTIVGAREDLSIPGAESSNGGTDTETRFFNLVRQHNPDVIILDLTNSPRHGAATILKIRHRSQVPILVVCAAADPLIGEYRSAGAVDAIRAPVDIAHLHQTVQQIIRLSQHDQASSAVAASDMQPVSFAGLTLHPHENLLLAADGSATKLTTS